MILYDYNKPKYWCNAKLCYMDTDTFIMRVKTQNVYEDSADGVDKRFGTSYYEIHRLLPKGKNIKVIGQ